MNADLLLVIQAVATIMAMFSIICRAAKMSRETPAPVRMQHLVMFAGLSFSLVLPALAGKTALVLAVLAWLSLSAHRWRHGVPEGLQAGE
jgi:hypothetical protein